MVGNARMRGSLQTSVLLGYFLGLKSLFNNVMDVSSQFFKGLKYSSLPLLFLLAVPLIPFFPLLGLLLLVYKNCLEIGLQGFKTLYRLAPSQFPDLCSPPHPLISYLTYSPPLCFSMVTDVTHLIAVCPSLIQNTGFLSVINSYLSVCLNSEN